MDLKIGFFRFLARFLVGVMVLQGMPLWELSQAYTLEFDPHRLLKAVDFLTSTVLSPTRAHAGVAPDPDNYTINNIPSYFLNISLSGTKLSPPLQNEDAASGTPIGFDFEYFGAIFNAVSITSNGYISFSPQVSYHNIPMPSVQRPQGLIAPFWDDLDPEQNPDSAVYYQTSGTAPNRQFIVQWNEIPLAADPDSRLTFEVVLFEGTHEIQFHYLSMLDGHGGSGTGMVSGRSATIGIESNDGTGGKEVAFNRNGAVTNGTSFSFTLAGNAYERGRLLGDLDADGRVTILDQSIMTDTISNLGEPLSSLDLSLSDLAPQSGTGDRFLGDGIVDASDHDLIFQVLMGREELAPTLSDSSAVAAVAGETITLSGSGFDPVAANNIIYFIDVEGNEIAAAAEMVNADGTELTVTVPAGLLFISSIRLERDSLSSNALAFVLEHQPLIVNLTPDSGEEEDIILIRGHEFGPTTLDNEVNFNGIPAAVNTVSTSDGYDELNVTIPEGAATGPVTVTVAGNTSNAVAFTLDEPPVVAINTPSDGAEITAPAEITGTASDLKLVRYTLEYGPLDGNFITIATGTESVTDDLLGALDPTMLVNGIYRLRLSAEDMHGNISSVDQDILVTGQMKVGINTMTFTDLQVPVSGIPITVRRTYDSRVKTKKDFGIGWSVDILDVELFENQTPGEGWYAVNTGAFLPNWELRSDQVHLILIRFPDGQTDVFEMKAYFDDPVLRTGDFAYVVFEPRSGNTSTLAPYAGSDLIYSDGTGQLLDWNDLTLYDPDRYLLTTKEGTELVINQETGLESMEDLNGNKLTINDNGIVHSSGKSISFERDAEERITRITDPMGRAIIYSYDENDDLVSVNPRSRDVVTMTYDGAHNLLDIIGPLDDTIFNAEYDDQGRLIATRDADGNRIDLTHDLDQMLSTVSDRLGNLTVYRYDVRGNVVSKTDALNNTTTYTYDDRDNLLTETDPLGNTTTYTYDENNNLLTATNPLSHTKTSTYNSHGQVLTITDPLGNTTINTYDNRSNLLTKTDPLGNTWTKEYDSSGNMIQQTDPDGNATNYEYNAYGWLTKEISPCGGEKRYDYDANGYQTRQTVIRTTSSGSEEIITSYQYDYEGRLTYTRYADGYSTRIEYDELGNRSATVDKLGRRTTYSYTPTGLLSQTTYPDGATEAYTYDAEGRRITYTDQNGNTTAYLYDKLGRKIQTIYADGSSTSTAYDAAGRMISQTDERGNTTSYDYDTAGRRLSTTNVLGETTNYIYDATRLASTEYPNGTIRAYEYDAAGRKTKTIYSDGTFKETTYDFANHETSRTDQAGLTTTYNYDACDRLVEVIDALGQSTTYTYDELGNRLSQSDANEHVTTWEYDSFSRVTRHTLPLGMSETMSYSAVGNLISKTDFNGDRLTYTYDIRNRRTRVNYPDGSSVLFAYTSGGQKESVTDSRGVTTYAYDPKGRLLERVDPDATVISYMYDEKGNRTSVTAPSGATTYTYDALNRLETVTDPDGGITTYTYDNAGNMTGMTYPHGTVTSYLYDDLNRLIYQENLRADLSLISSYTYTQGPAGNRLKVIEHSGRVVDYTYDELYGLIEEKITDPVLGNQTISYTYDSVGNRLTRTDSGGTINYAYDSNDRLLSEDGIIYTYDDNGNILRGTDGVDTTNYTYDYENRLISVQTPDSVIDYIYDVDGIRVSSSVDSIVTNYVVDKNRRYAQVLEERDDSGALIAGYIYGYDLISRQWDTDTEYYNYDGHGSVRQLTDASESITDSYTYEGFGELLDHDGTSANPYLYVGEQYDPHVGFYNLRARYYNPAIGRFLTMDSFTGFPSDLKSLHKYVYSENDPVNNIDPSGQFVGVAGALLVVAVIGVLATVPMPAFAQAGDRMLRMETNIYYIEGDLELEVGGRWLPLDGWNETNVRAVTGAASSVMRNLFNIELHVNRYSPISFDDPRAETDISEIESDFCPGWWGPTRIYFIHDAGGGGIAVRSQNTAVIDLGGGVDDAGGQGRILAHELGHTLSLDDVSSRENLMFGGVESGGAPGGNISALQREQARRWGLRQSRLR